MSPLKNMLEISRIFLCTHISIGSIWAKRNSEIFDCYIQGGAVNHGLNRFFHCIGLYILLRRLFGLKSTGCCGLDPWLTIFTIFTSFFLATA
jgi:hypothetical protein